MSYPIKIKIKALISVLIVVRQEESLVSLNGLPHTVGYVQEVREITCAICDGQSGTGTRYSPSFRFLSVNIISPWLSKFINHLVMNSRPV
jgi:hypothetical protein